MDLANILNDENPFDPTPKLNSSPIPILFVSFNKEDENCFNRSEEHTSELQSPCNLVCRLLLEKKKNNHIDYNLTIPLQQLNVLETLIIIMVANKYAFLQISRRRFLHES